MYTRQGIDLLIIVSVTLFSACGVCSLGTTILEGDVYMEIMTTGFTTLHDNGTCSDVDTESLQNVEAIRWTLEKLNRNIDSYIRGLSKGIGLRWSATCGSTVKAEELALRLAIELENNTEQDIIGLIGPGFSPATQSVSVLLSSLSAKNRLLQMDYSSTSTRLNDRSIYKNLFRTLPSDDIQTKMLQLFLKSLRWTYVAIIYEDGDHGHAHKAAILEQTTSRDICFPVVVAISTTQIGIDYLADVLSNKVVNASVPVHGGIVFGSHRFAINVMKAAERITNQLEDNTRLLLLFTETSGLSSLKTESLQGSYAVTAPIREIEEFQEHWDSVVKEQFAIGNELSQSWLSIYTTNLQDIEPSIYNQYAIQAGLILAKVVKVVYEDICMGSDPCESINTAPRQTFIDAMAGLSVDFDNDFDGVRLKEFQKPDLIVSINSDMEITRSSEFAIYEAYNFQKCDLDQQQTCTKKVANLTSTGELISEPQYIRDYATDGTERRWPDVRKAQCPRGYTCHHCLSQTASQDYILFEPGDMYVIGIVPVHNPGTAPLNCGEIKSGGLDIVEVIRFVVKDAETTFSNLIPTGNIGVVIIDSCNDAHIIQEKVLNLHRKGVLKDGGYIPIAGKVIGYIGGWSSDVSTAVVSLTSRLGLVQISYASTAPSLSSQSLFPYFLRTPSPDNAQAATLLQLVQHFNSNFIQILYSETAYGEGGRDEIESLANKFGVCIAQTVGVRRTSNSKHVIQQLRRQSGARVVVCFLGSFEIEPLVQSLNDDLGENEFVFISSEGWGTRVDISEYRNLKGSITLTSELPINQKFKDRLSSLNAKEEDADPWIREYLGNYFGCYYEWSYDKQSGQPCSGSERLDLNTDYSIDVWVSFAERAALSLLQGARTTLDDLCGGSGIICTNFTNNPDILFNAIKRIEFRDEGGTTRSRVFDDKGDGLAGYKIYVVDEKGQYARIGASDSSTFTFDDSRYPGTTDINSKCSDQEACNKCFPSSSTDDEDALPVVWIAVTVGLVTVILVLAGFLVFLYHRLGCCITIDEGRPKFNEAYLTPIDMRNTRSTRRLPGPTDDEYASIRESYSMTSTANDYVLGHHTVVSTKQ